MTTDVIGTSKSVKAQPARTKSTYEYIDATPMINKVNAELYEYRLNKYNKSNNQHNNDIDFNNKKKQDNDTALDREVERLLRSSELDKLKSYTNTVNEYGANGLHRRQHKKLLIDSLVAKGAKRPTPDSIPYNIAHGMRNKNKQRESDLQQRQRDMGIYQKSGVSNKRARLEQYKSSNGTSIDNGLKMKFGRTDKSGVLNIRDNELSNVHNESKQRINGLKQTFKRTTNKRAR